MSDVSLLGMGCVVTFIAVAGVYVYMRECYMAEDRPEPIPVKSNDKEASERLRKVA